MNNANEPQLISSFRDFDDDLVEEMRRTKNYAVTLYRIAVTGVEYLVVIDGHHSLEAAKLDGVEPLLREVPPDEHDYEVSLVGVEQWLEDTACDSPWFFTDSGYDVWA